MFEGMCTASEVRVIATARSEEEQWKVLEFSQYDRLWNRFERVELPEPSISAIVNLLEDTTKQADIKGNEKDFEVIARKNDGTYRNILINMRRWDRENKDVNTNDFRETLNGSWREIYESAVGKHPAVRFVYDAIDILRQAGIDLFPFLVEPTAVLIWGGNNFQKLIRRREINRAIHYLSKDTTILRQANGKLTPSDGQIEAGREPLLWIPYEVFLTQLLLNSKYKKISNSIYGLAVACYYEKRFEQSFKLIQRYIELNPSDSDGQNVLGILLKTRERYDEAEAAYRKAIELNPSEATAYNNLMILLRVTGREQEALPVLEKMIQINPEDFNSYLGIASIKKTMRETIESDLVMRAREYIPPDDFYNRACLESVCDHFDLAFEYLEKAAQKERFNPKWAWEDPDLQWIRNDPRFTEIVGQKPE
ncbi:MAG: tetratricopeptide repeat protein [Anaerolineales bacterium]|nr:tetratricopeptide repeat protein [Anaerolineales bacterium]